MTVRWTVPLEFDVCAPSATPTNTRNTPECFILTRTRNFDEPAELWCSDPPATLTHCVPRCFWIANWAPSSAGETVPENVARLPECTWWLCRFRRTPTAAATVMTGATTFVPDTTAWNCVLTPNDRIGNDAMPWALVTTALPACANGAVYGNIRACRMIVRLALSVPVSVAVTVVDEPASTGLGLASSDRPSGCLGVVNAASAPSVVPAALTATSRKW